MPLDESGRGSVPVELILLRFSSTREAVSNLRCLRCDASLDVHQPDTGFPERMLGTCDSCRSWFLMESLPGRPEALMVLLPDGDYFRNAAGV